MDTFAWLEASLLVKAGWKFVSMESGEEFVVILLGTLMMSELCADSWGFPLMEVLMQLLVLYSLGLL